jgi:hypothetical protein
LRSTAATQNVAVTVEGKGKRKGERDGGKPRNAP